jgi:hypothetical protein
MTHEEWIQTPRLNFAKFDEILNQALQIAL